MSLLALLVLLVAGPALADSTRAADDGSARTDSGVATDPGITLERIMSDTDWLGGAPDRFYWSSDGDTVYFERDPADPADDDERLWRLPVDGTRAAGEAEEVPLDELGRTEPAGGDWNRDRTRRVYELNGDIFLRRADAGADVDPLQLTRTAARESSPFFLVGDQRIGFQRDGTWLVRDLATGLEYQPAEVVAAEDPADEEPSDDFLSEQQRRLFEVIREDEATEERRRERSRERRQADPAAVPPPFYLGKGQEILGSSLSPAGDAILVLTAPESRDEGQQDKMPNYVGADGYVEIRDVRRKVGVGGDYSHSLTLLDLADHELHAVDLSGLPGLDEDPLAELKQAAQDAEKDAEEHVADDDEEESLVDSIAEETDDAQLEDNRSQGLVAESQTDDAEAESTDAQSADVQSADETEKDADQSSRHVRIYGFEWSPEGEHVVVFVRSHDNKDRWLVLLSREQPEPVVAHRLTMEGWINWDHNDFGWLPDGRLYFLSEQTGTSHLHVYDPDTGDDTALTSGDFVVADPQADPTGRNFYVVANPERPTSYDVYRVSASGGDLQRITDLGGLVDFRLSPSGDRLLVRGSHFVEPPELFLQPARAGADANQITDTTSDAFEALDWLEPQIVQVPSSHQDRPIWGRYYPPRDPQRLRDADGNVPAVLFVHGAGYLQNAHEGWSGYFREFMFHSLLADHGYAVLDLDYRGSKGYGADWRQAIYRHMGQPELEDLLDGRRWLMENHDVDGDRVGIYGGSYGGFMVMMALFKEPGTFAAGAALRPVTDWAHYNHGYTSNILNTPQVDPEAYARSSPIEFAEGLEDPLLICAPMLDDNVFFQDVVRLTQKLIELDKTSFEVALFPVEPHGFRRPSSWLAEYRRIFGLFEEHLTP